MSSKRKREVHAPRDFALVPYKGAAVYKRRRAGGYSSSQRPFRAGRDRVGGYYGRFAGSNAELKFLDTTVDDAIIAAGGVVTDSVNLVPQGVTESQRVGRKCTLRQIFWRGNVTIPLNELEGGPGAGDRVRLIMYVDKQANGATATQAGILESTNYDAYRNLANSGRFVILMDRMITLNYLTCTHFAVNSFSHAKVNRQFSFFKRCAIPLEFDNTTGAITEIRSNNVGILIMCENGDAGITSQVRVRFSDQG